MRTVRLPGPDGPPAGAGRSAIRRQGHTSLAESRMVWPSGQDGPSSSGKKVFALIQKNFNFETHIAVSPHAHVTVYALCDGTSQVIRPTYSCPCPMDLGQPYRCT
jgi:hypothetical protein